MITLFFRKNLELFTTCIPDFVKFTNLRKLKIRLPSLKNISMITITILVILQSKFFGVKVTFFNLKLPEKTRLILTQKPDL
jgi:hypothetical protein